MFAEIAEAYPISQKREQPVTAFPLRTWNP